MKTKAKGSLKKSGLVLLLLLTYFLSMALQQWALTGIGKSYKSWSLRFQEGIDKNSQNAARRYCREKDYGWLTFWTEKALTLKTERRSTEGIGLCYDGDPAFAASLDFVKGFYTGEQDSSSVAISESIAWALFGSNDIIGMELEIGGDKRTVKGVFRDTFIDILYQDSNELFTAGELHGDRLVSYEEIGGFVSASGLGTVQSVVDGEGISRLFGFFAYLPLVAIGVSVLFLFTTGKGKWMWIIRFAAVFLFGILFAFLLPKVLGSFPQWMIPTKWSDLGFWQNLAGSLKGHVSAWLALYPSSADLYVKWQMIYFSVGTITAVLSVVILYFNVKVSYYLGREIKACKKCRAPRS